MEIENWVSSVCQASFKAFPIGCTCMSFRAFAVEAAVFNSSRHWQSRELLLVKRESSLSFLYGPQLVCTWDVPRKGPEDGLSWWWEDVQLYSPLLEKTSQMEKTKGWWKHTGQRPGWAELSGDFGGAPCHFCPPISGGPFYGPFALLPLNITLISVAHIQV